MSRSSNNYESIKIMFFIRMALKVDTVYLYPNENAKQHKTDKYELVHDEENPIAIFRRGLQFTVAVRFSNRGFTKSKDIVRLLFDYGKIYT